MRATKVQFDKVIASQTELSLIDGRTGRLFIRGVGIQELARDAEFEDIFHLLLHGSLLRGREREDFRRSFVVSRCLSELSQTVLNCFPSHSRPIDVVKAVLAAEGAIWDDTKSELETMISCVATLPTIVAAAHRLRQHLKPLPAVRELGHAANFLYMLSGEKASEQHAKAMDTYMVLMAEHSLNASTLNARVIASTGATYYPAVIGAICALQGPLHGGAPPLVLNQIDEALCAADIEKWCSDQLAKGLRLMGFGHPVYETIDPRSEIFKGMLQVLDPEMHAKAHDLEQRILSFLRYHKPEHPWLTNVEYYSALVLRTIGVPSDLLVTAFACARIAGWSAHIAEQRKQQKNGLTGVMHPRSVYIGKVAAGAEFS